MCFFLFGISCTQKKTITTSIPDTPNIPNVPNIPDGDVGGFTSILASVDTTNAKPAVTVTFVLKNAQPSDIFTVSTSIKNTSLNNGWLGVSSDKSSCTGTGSTVCNITFNLDATNINLGSSDDGSVAYVSIPFSYTVNGKASKTSVMGAPYKTDHLKWKSEKTNYNAQQLYLDSPIVLSSSGAIYMTAGNVLYAINADGTTKWKETIEDVSTILNPALGLDENSIYLLGTISDSYQYIKVTGLVSGFRTVQYIPATGDKKFSFYSSTKPIVYKDSRGEENIYFLSQINGSKTGSQAPLFKVKGTDPFTSTNLSQEPSTPFPFDQYGYFRSGLYLDRKYLFLSGTTNGTFLPAKIMLYDLENKTTTTYTGNTGFVSAPNFVTSTLYVAGTADGQLVSVDFSSSISTPNSSISLCSPSKAGFCDISGQPVFNSDKSLVYVGTNRDPLFPNAPSSDSGQYDNTLYAIPVANGKLGSTPNWCYRAGGNLNDGFTRTPAMGVSGNSKDILYAISNNILMAFSVVGTSANCGPQDPNSGSYQDRSTGHPPLWTFPLAPYDNTRNPANMPSSPLLSADGNTLYVLSSTGYLYALKTKSSSQ